MSKLPEHCVTTTVQDGVLVLTVTERQLYGDTLAEKIRQEFMAAMASSGIQQVVINLQPVEYLSTAAFRPLLSLRRKLQESGGRMVLCHLAPLVNEVFHILRLTTTSRSYPATFDVQPDVASAVAFLRNPPPAPPPHA
jgi:anti-anti-sigma factor